MSNVKKCDRCGKVYSFDYLPKHARVMVYDGEGHLHSTDLCPECDRAAGEWMKIEGNSERIPCVGTNNVVFFFKDSSKAEDFIDRMISIAQKYGVATELDAWEEYEHVTQIKIDTKYIHSKRGWDALVIDSAALLETRSGWLVVLPCPADKRWARPECRQPS